MVKRLTVQYLSVTMLAMLPLAAMTEVRVELQRSNIMENESFLAAFKVFDATKTAEPDWSPLRQDFRILNKSQSYFFQNVNGRKQSVTTWQIELIPKRSGNLTLPALSFSHQKSQPQKIRVQARAAAQRHNMQDIYIEVSANPLDPYVQQQVRFVFKVFMTKNLNGNVTQPSFNGDVTMEPMPEKKYRVNQQGKNYQVYERSYMLYPQASGTIRINPLVLTGQYIQNGRRFSVTEHSQALQLNVRPVPPAFTGSFWLPASRVQLHQEWSDGPAQWVQGEPLTRTVKLIGNGLLASQLPGVEVPQQQGLNVYADANPVLRTLHDTSGLRGERTQKFVLIPTQSGRHVLPEIKIPWWNTRTDQLEYAILERQDVEVKPAALSQLTTETLSPPLPQTENADPAQSQPVERVWIWLSAVLGCGWLLTLVWILRHQIMRHISKYGMQQSHTAALKQACKNVEKACATQNVSTVRNALLQWAGVVWPDHPPRSLSDISRRCTPSLKRRIQAFDQAAYGHGKWHADSLWQAVLHEPVKTQAAAENCAPPPLEPLYK